jgi:6-phosphogluconolactonase
MKWKQWSQNLLAGSAVAGLGLGLVSCGASNTIDYLYSTSATNNPGQINVYRVDSESGALSQIGDSPYNAGRNPVSLAIDSTGLNLYVANHDDNTVEQFGIGTDAKLYGQHTINPTGSDPIAVAVHTYTDSSGNVTGELLFVVETYQPGFTDLNPGPGALYVYNLGTTGALPSGPVTQTVNGQSLDYLPLGTTPTAVTVTDDGEQVFVADQLTAAEASTNAQCPSGGGGVHSFNVNSSGALTETAGSPFCVGTTPSALATHPYSTFLYVTDSSQNQIDSFQIQKTATASVPIGTLTALPSGPVATGTTPEGITVDPRGDYVYVSNYNGSSISGYAVNLGTGGLSALATGGSGATGGGPQCIIVEPALGRFIYTANFIDGSLSGFQLNPDTGALSATQGQFYQDSGRSSCVAATQHGNHPVIQPTSGSGIQ